MSTEALLYVALIIGPLLGAVVGFGLQLHQLRQAKLNYEKARLEIEALRDRAHNESKLREKLSLEVEDLRLRVEERAGSKLKLAQTLSTDEVIRYADIRFSRGSSPIAEQSKRQYEVPRASPGPSSSGGTFARVAFVVVILAGAFLIYKFLPW